MNAVELTDLADRLADELTMATDGAPPGTLAALFERPRPAGDDRELLAVTAAALRLRTIADHVLACACTAMERAELPARKRVCSAARILMGLGAAPAVAHRAARLGRAAADPRLAPVTRGMRDGAVSAERADAVAAGLGHVIGRVQIDDDVAATVVASLMVQSCPARVKDKARAWAIRLTPIESDDGRPPVAERDELNEMTLDRTDDGRFSVTVDLDVLAGEELSVALDPLTRPVPEPDGSTDRRSSKRRRADAFMQMVRSYLARGERPESGGVLPHVCLVVPMGITVNGRLTDGAEPNSGRRRREGGDGAAEVFRIPLADIDGPRDRVAGDGTAGVPVLGFGGPVSARTAEMVMCEASVAAAMVDADGVPLSVGREKRLFPPGIRKALVIRDGGCAFPGCGLPPSWCDAHHCMPWSHGGETCLDNGVLLCRRHHGLVHHGGWEVFIGHDRHPWFVPPADPDRPGRRCEPTCANNRRTLTILPGAA
ncbi:DUF222 domain-containing protein [Gordonia sp. FQ]|uniref:HNH endonuclease signature motif containing protein n=1 Tax=Gordonia sp. FQ TaxID=3446634 RepID=UPI003F872D30